MPVSSGHPDYLATAGGPVPLLLGNVGSFPVGAWGPVSVPVLSGGTYLLALEPAISTETCITDVTVFHFDSLGNVVFVDTFNGVIATSGGSQLIQMSGPTIIRGNIYGTSISVEGICASSTFMNTLYATSGIVACGVNIEAYVLPYNLPDSNPHIFAGGAILSNLPAVTPGSLLLSQPGTTLLPGVTNPRLTIVPYSGPAVLQFQEIGVSTTPNNVECLIESHSVNGGPSTVLVHQNWRIPAANQGNAYPVNLPPMLNTYVIFNLDGAQSATFRLSLIAGTSP
jgi:hypothetical protein